MITRRLIIHIEGDHGRLLEQMVRYSQWPAWRRWLWRKGLHR